MKTTVAFLAVVLRLVSSQGNSLTSLVSVEATGTAPASSPSGGSGSGGGGGVASNGAVCGQGYTYCGSMLTEHQGFQSADVVKAYCSANETNCANGKTRTDPLQGLYVCLPPTASPKRDMGMAMFHSNKQFGSGHRGSQMLGAKAADSAPAAAPSTQCSAGSTSTTGNRIELLCSCSSKCLNPETDHIARCDASCS